ncbi:threonine synthase domain protein [Peptoniphilus sp. oral taxon 375 str. F0436]|nr:threonine synthase domain protein [Peptoniphilus sp. oral taxon 375 str. F0436]
MILSTASPYKFPHTVLKALGEEGDWTDKEAIDHLAKVTGEEVPSAIGDLWIKNQKPEELISYQDMKKIVEKIGDGE